MGLSGEETGRTGDGGRPGEDGRPVLEIRGLSVGYPSGAGRHGGEVRRHAGNARRYGGEARRDGLVLRDVSLYVRPGELVCVIGPNGAGKSTLLKAVAGFLPPCSGEILLEGRPLQGLPTESIVRSGLGYVPQTGNVFPSLTVLENLEVACQRPALWRQRAEQALELFPELAGRLRVAAGRLSGGERQMLALAMALVNSPSVLLLDEPSAGLAPKVVATVFEKVKEIHRTGVAVLMVEQNARLALEASHRAYVLDMGSVALEGRAGELLDNPDVVRLYLGASSPDRVQAAGDDTHPDPLRAAGADTDPDPVQAAAFDTDPDTVRAAPADTDAEEARKP